MNFKLLVHFDNLLEEVSTPLLRNIFNYSSAKTGTLDNWEYAWDLDIMNMNFPFLY